MFLFYHTKLLNVIFCRLVICNADVIKVIAMIIVMAMRGMTHLLDVKSLMENCRGSFTSAYDLCQARMVLQVIVGNYTRVLVTMCDLPLSLSNMLMNFPTGVGHQYLVS